MNTLTETLRSFGIYRVFFSSVIQYNSICFRVIGGLMYPNLLKSVAFVTALEFFLNSLLELPFGKLSDKYGRARLAILGVFLVALGSLCLYFAFLNHEHTQLAYYFLTLNALFIGVGKPLYSGSVESFYQSVLNCYKSSTEDEKIISNSLSASSHYGRFVPIVFVLLAFTSLIWFENLGVLSLCFFVSFTFFISMSIKLWIDYRKASKIKGFVDASESLITDFEPRITDKKLFLYSSVVNLITMLIAMLNLGYYILSLGRNISLDSIEQYFSFAVYMIGIMGLGWVLSASLLPKLATKLLKPVQNQVFFGLLLCTNLAYYFLKIPKEIELLLIYLIGYGAIFQLSFSGLMNSARNISLDVSKKEHFAANLSLQNIPSFITVALASSIIAFNFNGALSLEYNYLVISTLAAIGLIYSLYVGWQNAK